MIVDDLGTDRGLPAFDVLNSTMAENPFYDFIDPQAAFFFYQK